MNLVMLSDTHLLWDKPIGRTDDLKTVQFDKLKFIFDYAKKTEAKIIIAGDVFNKPRSWHLLPMVVDFLKGYDPAEVEVMSIFGQHDTYFYSEDTRDKTNLGVLAKAGLVTILDENERTRTRSVSFYGCSYGQEIPKVKNKDTFNILAIHAPIAEKALYPNQNYMDALTFLKEHEDFNLIVCGDIHQKFIKEIKERTATPEFTKGTRGRYIVNSGPLLRKEANIYNFTHKPGFWFFDTDKKETPVFVEVPHSPAEEVLSRTHIEYEKESNEILNDFISSVAKTEVDEGSDFVTNLWAFTKANNIDQKVVNLLSEVINANKAD